jgi:hypothetical protein
LRVYFEFSKEGLDKGINPLFLEICRFCGYAVGYNADADCLAVAVPAATRNSRPLLLPFFARLNLAVLTPKAVADNEMAVDILGVGYTVKRSELFQIA